MRLRVSSLSLAESEMGNVMISTVRIVAIGAATLMLSACGGRYYPIVGKLEPAAANMSCQQLVDERDRTLALQQDIDRIASSDRSNANAKPVLYSMKKSDADTAVTNRVAELDAVMTARPCPVR